MGPPGVGKTSIAMSMAKAMNRKLARLSLGGVSDEGAPCPAASSPPFIMRVANPLLLLDEIDKLGNDYRGDPASALLEVLDAEQNPTFRDNFWRCRWIFPT